MSRWSPVRCPHPSTHYLLRTVDLLRSRRTQGNRPRTMQSTGKLLGSRKQLPFTPVKIPVDKSIHQHSPSTLTRAGLFERCQLNHVLLYRKEWDLSASEVLRVGTPFLQLYVTISSYVEDEMTRVASTNKRVHAPHRTQCNRLSRAAYPVPCNLAERS